MIVRLLPENIVHNWDTIRYAAIQVNRLTATDKIKEYCTGLLINLLSDKAQCWFSISDDNQIKAVAVTKIIEDVGKVSYVFIEVVYGYGSTTPEEKKDFFIHLNKFCENIKADKVITWMTDDKVMRLAEGVGFREIARIYAHMGGHI